MQQPKDYGQNVEVFKYCYGTPLDKQLHQELYQTRISITKLHSEYHALTPIKTMTPVVYHFTALAKIQTDPTIDRPEKNKPIQSVFERYVQLKGCKYIDEIFRQRLHMIHQIHRLNNLLTKQK